jgi:hypothetical protein
MDITGESDAQNFHIRTDSCLSNTGLPSLFLKSTGKRGGQKGRKGQ